VLVKQLCGSNGTVGVLLSVPDGVVVLLSVPDGVVVLLCVPGGVVVLLSVPGGVVLLLFDCTWRCCSIVVCT
jgi:hypothetical protein